MQVLADAWLRQSAYFDPTPRQLVKSRHVACGTDGIRVRADIHNGRMTLSVNGETITPLEDKSLGCVQKGGSAPVEDVLLYGERVKEHGLSLMTGPGNDLVASTVLAAAGCHLILFTTGRGTPFGCVVPTLKIASNDALAEGKPNWIDWNAMSNPDVEAFAEKIISVASGEKAKNELAGDRGIAIFKDGVTL